MSESRGICCLHCCKFFFTMGLTALFMWLSLRTSDPTCSIQRFYAPSLNATLNATNTTLYFDLKLDNSNKDKGIYYDPINLTFYYGASSNSSSIGNLTVDPFYQGHKKNAHRRMLVQTQHVPWPDARKNGTLWFRMELETKVRYKILFWKKKREKIAVGAAVEVNATTGVKMHKKGIKLKSGVAERRGYGAPAGGLLGIVAALILVDFYCFDVIRDV